MTSLVPLGYLVDPSYLMPNSNAKEERDITGLTLCTHLGQ